MIPIRCRIICFSPTGTTRKIVESIAAGTGLPVSFTDITLPENRNTAVSFSPEELIILGAPVYYGRVQKHAVEYFSTLRADGQPAILVVNYGNRHYDDALLELFTIAGTQGFHPVAAGAFTSEHSFSTKEFPMAVGRPDGSDIEKAFTFGERAMKCFGPDMAGLSHVPGTNPYKAYPDFHRAPVSKENCTLCGLCARVCPTGAICLTEKFVETDEQQCIVCQACVRFCPEEARVDIAPGATETRNHLKPLVAARKEPEFFF